MIKTLLFAKRKSGLSRQEFMDHYNNVHIPLCTGLSPALKNKAVVRRNFVLHEQVMLPQGFSGELDYDVVTESIWPDRDSFNEFLADVADEENIAQVVADEENFFDRASMRLVVVEVHEDRPDQE